MLALRATDSASWYTFSAENGLSGNIVQAIWEDAQGRLWFGTENGASSYDGLHWQQFRADPVGLIDNNVWAIAGDTTSVWFATSNGLSRLQKSAWTSYSIRDGLPNNDVRAVTVAQDGTVWVGTFGGGIARLRPGATRWELVNVPLNTPNNDLIVSTIWQAPAGDLWFSTSGRGALRLRDSRWEPFTFRQANRNTVWAVGGAGDLTWMATFRGIVQVDANSTIRVVNDTVDGIRLDEAEILAVAAQPDGVVWFGTRSRGVLRFANGSWQHFSERDGLSRSYVQSAFVDQRGRVWFGTRGGGVTMRDPRPPATDGLQVQLRALDIGSGTEIALDQNPLRFEQNRLQFIFRMPIAWVPSQSVSFRYWLLPDIEAAQQEPHTVSSPAAQQIKAESNVQDVSSLAPGSYTLRVVPIIGETAGPEAQQRFTILAAPPQLSADAINIRAEAGAALPRGATLGPALFESHRQVQLEFPPAAQDSVGALPSYEYRLAGADQQWQRASGTHATLELPVGTHQIEARAVDAQGNSSAPAQLTVVVPGPQWQTILLALVAILTPGILGGVIGVVGYRRWSRRQALLRALRGHLIPYDVGPLISTPERYIGRRHVLDAMIGRIEHNSFYVYGERRIGKTSLLAQLRQLLEQRNALSSAVVYIPVFRNIQDLPQEQFWQTLMRSIAEHIDPRPELALDTLAGAGYSDLDAQDDLEVLIAHARQLYAPRRPLFVLLIDEIDTIERYEPIIRQRFRAFCQHLQDSLQVVLVGVAAPRAQAGDTSPWSNIFAPVALGPIDQEATLQLIRDYNHNPYSYTAEAEQALLRAGDHKPFDTQWLCAEAVKSMLADKRTQVVYEDVAHATRILARERRREYADLWQKLDAELQQDLRQTLSDGGRLAADRVAFGRYDQLFEAGIALGEDNEYRLSYLFQDWLRETQ